MSFAKARFRLIEYNFWMSNETQNHSRMCMGAKTNHHSVSRILFPLQRLLGEAFESTIVPRPFAFTDAFPAQQRWLVPVLSRWHVLHASWTRIMNSSVKTFMSQPEDLSKILLGEFALDNIRGGPHSFELIVAIRRAAWR